MLSLLLFTCFVTATYSSYSLFDDDETIRKLDRLDRYLKGRRDEMERRTRSSNKKHIIMEGRSSTNKYTLNENEDIINSFQAQKYVMNIEDSVQERWGDLCALNTDDYINLYNGFDAIFKSQEISQQIYAAVSYWFKTFVSDPYKEEIEFFSNCTGVPLHGVITLNLMEIFLVIGCTSIVATDDDNALFHGRNLDLWLNELQPVVVNLSFMADYRSQGVTLFEGQSFFGYSGIFNGVKPAAFSISVDSRYTTSVAQNLAVLQQGYSPMSWMIRDTLLNSVNYQHAMDTAMHTPVTVPAYLIIAGLYYPDGVVITRNFTHTVNLATLDNTDLEWFVVVTNYDFWDPNYNGTKERRDAAIENMNIITRSGMSSYSMYLVMCQVPTTNSGTVSTSVFSAVSVNDSDNEMHRNQIVNIIKSEESSEIYSTTVSPVESQESSDIYSTVSSLESIADKEEKRNNGAGIVVVIVVCLIMAGFIGYVYYGKRKNREERNDKAYYAMDVVEIGTTEK